MMENETLELENLSLLIAQTAQNFSYPTTPDIAAQVRRQSEKAAHRPLPRLAWAVAALLLIAGLLLAVPQVRAAVVDFIRAGALTLRIVNEAPATNALSTLEETIFTHSQNLSPAEAQELAGFSLFVPSKYGNPDAIYLPDIEGVQGQVAVMLWRDAAAPDGVQLLLYQIDAPFFGIKEAAASSVRSTHIAGSEAFWIEGQHTFILGREQTPNLVTRNVLVWNKDGMTYRLESDLSFEEMVQLARSLHPWPE